MFAGELVSFVAYTFIIGASIGGLGNFYPELIGSLGATERIREILNMDGEIDLDTKPQIDLYLYRETFVLTMYISVTPLVQIFPFSKD